MAFSLRSMALNTGALAAGEVMCRFFSLGLVMTASRILGPSQMGTYAFCVAFTGNFLIVLDFGLESFISREIARNPSSAVGVISVISTVKTYLFLAVIPVAVAGALLSDSPQKRTLLLIMTGTIFSTTHLHSIYAYFRGRMEAWKQSLTTIVQRLLVAVLGILLILTGRQTTALALVELLVGMGTLLFCLVVLVKPRPTKFVLSDTRECISLVKRTWSFAALALVWNLYNTIDLMMLSWLADSVATGYFSSAEKLGALVSFIPSAMAGTLLPFLARIASTRESSYGRSVRSLVKLQAAVGAAIAVVFISTARELPLLLFGEQYLPVRSTIMLMSPGVFILFVNQSLTLALISSDREVRMLKIFLACLALNVALNLVAIPYLRDRGAALTTVVCSVVMTVLQYQGIRSDKRAEIGLYRQVWRPLLGLMVAAGISLRFVPEGTFIGLKAALSLLMFLVVLILTGGVRPDHLRFLHLLRDKGPSPVAES